MQLALDQIQANILREYVYPEGPKFARYLFVELRDAGQARTWLQRLLPELTCCSDYDASSPLPYVLNVALSYVGVEKLGFGAQCHPEVGDSESSELMQAYKEGMVPRAKMILGDDEDSAVEHWDPAYAEGKIGAVVSLSAMTESGIEDAVQLVTDAMGDLPEVVLLTTEVGAGLEGQGEGTEHFGFVDGISQPDVEGAGVESHPGQGVPTGEPSHPWRPVRAGEFVLGYRDEAGRTQLQTPFFKNGSFMVFRKLQQRVAAFRDYIRRVATTKGVDEEFIAAKMMGRWRSGAPLVLSPNKDDPELGHDPKHNNDFVYGHDEEGFRCPFGAHIRRNNPRDDPTGPQILQTKQHRIIRRAIPYGTRLPDDYTDDGQDRGVLFVVINSDIVRQFEYVQLNWVNSVISSRRLTAAADRDPIIGAQLPDPRNPGKRAGKIVFPEKMHARKPIIAWNLPRFVTTKGGGYYFLPSRDTLARLAGQAPDPSAPT